MVGVGCRGHEQFSLDNLVLLIIGQSQVIFVGPKPCFPVWRPVPAIVTYIDYDNAFEQSRGILPGHPLASVLNRSRC